MSHEFLWTLSFPDINDVVFSRYQRCCVPLMHCCDLRPVPLVTLPVWFDYFSTRVFTSPHFSSQIDALCWDATFQALDNQTIMYNCRTPRAPVPPFSITDKYTAIIQLMLLMTRRQSCRFFFPLWTFFFHHFDLSWFDKWTYILIRSLSINMFSCPAFFLREKNSLNCHLLLRKWHSLILPGVFV